VDPEQYYTSITPQAKRKDLAQFFTPPEIAEFMVKWVLDVRPRTILDPAAGTGIFVRKVSDINQAGGKAPSVLAMDVDPDILKVAKESLESCPNVQYKVADFLKCRLQVPFDAVVCNPPYYKHHFVEDKKQLVGQFNRRYGSSLTRMTSVYCLFLIKAVNLLAAGGRGSFIIPSEFMNADYGVAVKSYLLEHRLLDAILVLDYESRAFSDALTTSCILLISKDPSKPREAQVKLFRARGTRDFADLCARILNGTAVPLRSLDAGILDPDLKWHNYFYTARPRNHPDLLPPLESLARCSRGIATGSNEYFTLSELERRQGGLSEDEVRACVTKSAQAGELVFTARDFERLRSGNKKCYLLYPGGELTPAMRHYLARGERLAVHEKFLTRNRHPWYRPEQRSPADIWVTVFYRGRPRFVLNEARILNLTTFHGIYLRPSFSSLREILFAYLNSFLCAEFIRPQRREYGDGLLKLEPRDVERILLPEFARMSGPDLDAVRDAVALLREGRLDTGRFLESIDPVFERFGTGLSGEHSPA
jgi:adenine-specific DNA-methyltransferase